MFQASIIHNTWKTLFWAHFGFFCPKTFKTKLFPKQSFQQFLRLYNDAIMESGVLIQRITKTKENQAKERKGEFLPLILKVQSCKLKK